MTEPTEDFPEDSYQQVLQDNLEMANRFCQLPADCSYWSFAFDLHGRSDENSTEADLPLAREIDHLLTDIYGTLGVDTERPELLSVRNGRSTVVSMPTRYSFRLEQHWMHDTRKLRVLIVGGVMPVTSGSGLAEA